MGRNFANVTAFVLVGPVAYAVKYLHIHVIQFSDNRTIKWDDNI